MTPNEAWEQRLAVTALLAIAEDALSAAVAVAPEDHAIKDQIHVARGALLKARDTAETLNGRVDHE